MKSGRPISKRFLVPVTLAVGAALGLGMITLVVHAAESAKKIEIVIKDKAATVLGGYVVTGDPTEIVVRNEDTVTHGFNSSLFEPNDKVVISGGYLAEGKGPHVYRVDAGKTMVLRFTPPRRDEHSSLSFWCDMHYTVRGEMLVMELTGESGG
ncbi:MAG: hypothetical protein E6K59_10880 [Nitrospirae bacterium]|nr:MAG: hypothetical protein E6K59_10880 [Nitrospirota bacterium]